MENSNRKKTTGRFVYLLMALALSLCLYGCTAATDKTESTIVPENPSAPSAEVIADSGTDDEFEVTEAPPPEPDFLSLIFDSYLLEGYTEISADDYGGQLAHPTALPDTYERYDAVFIKENPGTPEEKYALITHLWYDETSNNLLTITQMYMPDHTAEERFNFIGTDEAGRSMSETFPWVSYRASFEMNLNDTSVYGYMLVTSAEKKDECETILRSMELAR